MKAHTNLSIANGDNADVSLFGTTVASSGISKYAYTPSSQLSMSDWPTLQELISAGTRLVMFLGMILYTSIETLLITLQITARTRAKFLTSWMSSATFSKQPMMLRTSRSLLVLSTDHLEIADLD